MYYHIVKNPPENFQNHYTFYDGFLDDGQVVLSPINLMVKVIEDQGSTSCQLIKLSHLEHNTIDGYAIKFDGQAAQLEDPEFLMDSRYYIIPENGHIVHNQLRHTGSSGSAFRRKATVQQIKPSKRHRLLGTNKLPNGLRPLFHVYELDNERSHVVLTPHASFLPSEEKIYSSLYQLLCDLKFTKDPEMKLYEQEYNDFLDFIKDKEVDSRIQGRELNVIKRRKFLLAALAYQTLIGNPLFSDAEGARMSYVAATMVDRDQVSPHYKNLYGAYAFDKNALFSFIVKKKVVGAWPKNEALIYDEYALLRKTIDKVRNLEIRKPVRGESYKLGRDHAKSSDTEKYITIYAEIKTSALGQFLEKARRVLSLKDAAEQNADDILGTSDIGDSELKFSCYTVSEKFTLAVPQISDEFNAPEDDLLVAFKFSVNLKEGVQETIQQRLEETFGFRFIEEQIFGGKLVDAKQTQAMKDIGNLLEL